jgi:GTP1/Obg family GTP-binding protein
VASEAPSTERDGNSWALLYTTAPTLDPTAAQEADRQAEIERQRWEAQRREEERRERERRRAQAVKESREQLFAIVKAWALADRIERFFDDAERRASALNWDDRAALLDRIKQARGLLGGTDALARLQQWKAPSEQ